MWSKIKNFLANEVAYLIGAPTMVMLGIVAYGILFDHWTFKTPEWKLFAF